ncbi:hypothetical protein M728_005351 (plasmid) [Ensifer sp. WSM1721]|uniref:hypothetical protein n=1 Tax=Ensifer sp. WSM1721 TaxID=1041159 RepID=UPI001FD90EDE|nr:hypothetical protein [Ensifer sp. WSM1721]
MPETRRRRQKRDRLPPLIPEQEAALQAYAARHGRRWKSILNAVWMGGAPHDDGGILRGLRNSHGPTWLQSYRLARGSSAQAATAAPAQSKPDTGDDKV